jgi:DMSO/TMAO reductase YedYZ molybdopterin-dependent catalytic subunit
MALAAWAVSEGPLVAFGAPAAEPEATAIPFLDAQAPGKGLRWENLTKWLTPTEELFAVSHYGTPAVDMDKWELKVAGLLKRPATFTLAELKARRQRTVTAVLECSGNSSSAGFMGAVGNVRCTGTPLGPLLRDCGIEPRAIEVVFFGADEKTEKIRDKDYPQNFARSLGRSDAMQDDVLLAYELNGQPLAKEHGGPLRLVVPGWFGIAWAKWLSRIELLDRRFMGKFMGREYVTIRGEETDGRTIWEETSVGPIDVKSVVARALRLGNGTVRFTGAAWTDGTPLKAVEVQIDGGAWQRAQVQSDGGSRYAWRFWQYDWTDPTAGDHTVVARAIDSEGRTQPAADDPAIKLKRTYWEANQQWVRKFRV